MLSIKLLILLICLCSLHSVPSHALTCAQLFGDAPSAIYLANPNSIIATPESLPTVRKTISTLKRLVRHARNKEDYKAQIYSQVLPELNETLALGEQIIKNSASNQDQVYDFFNRSVVLIDHGITVGDSVGRAADGFNNMGRFTNKGFHKRYQELHHGHDLSNFPLDKFLEKNKKALEPRFDKTTLLSGFEYITIAPEITIPDNLQFNFQYKNIFKEGVLTLEDLFKDRENGITYLGISQSEVAHYDGQHGDAVSFLRHDRIHTYTQKYFDKLLFEEFKAKRIEQMILLKTRTNALLQARIKEYHEIKDPALKDAVRILFFAFLHEQSRSYPIGVEHDFKNPIAVEFYTASTPEALKEGRFGEEYKYLLDKPEKMQEAMEWLKTRVIEDANTLRSQY